MMDTSMLILQDSANLFRLAESKAYHNRFPAVIVDVCPKLSYG